MISPGIQMVAAYILALVLLYVAFRLFYVPLRVLARVGYHLVLGGVMIWVVNLVGGLWGFHLALNPVSALLAGTLGMPGLLLLAGLRMWML